MELKKYVDHYKKAIKFCISHFTMIELDFKLQENISKTYLFYQFFYNLSFEWRFLVNIDVIYVTYVEI